MNWIHFSLISTKVKVAFAQLGEKLSDCSDQLMQQRLASKANLRNSWTIFDQNNCINPLEKKKKTFFFQKKVLYKQPHLTAAETESLTFLNV